MRLVECVPNFSEGQDRRVIDAIAAVIEASDGAHLLDVDPGKDTNRTVVTFVADYDSVVDAAFNAIAAASSLIDMSKHKGAHARMGATDVCPLVPVRGVTMEDCVKLANDLGKRVGEELGIAVYLYEYAAKTEERRNLASIRTGEYEGLADKLRDPRWRPDYGPATFNAKSGATVIGARQFLIAYNVNLNTRDRKLANDIALSIREAGRARRDDQGRMMKDSHGNRVMVPGALKACKAVGWYIDEYKRAQVSINLTNANVTPPAVAFEEVKRQAEKRGVRVTGSELVGLIPIEAMLHAGRHFLTLQGRSTGVPDRELIETAVQSLGLNDLSPFVPDEKIIEYRVAGVTPLVSGSVREFVDDTSLDSPVPGGGSVAALMGSLAAALSSMVANLTVGKKGYENVCEEMKSVAVKAQALKAALLSAVDEDSAAFDGVMSAMRLPKKTDEERTHRQRQIEGATKRAVAVPLKVLRLCKDLIDPIEAVAGKGNTSSISDAGVAAASLRAAASGAYLNVMINLPGLTDQEYVKETAREASEFRDTIAERSERIFDQVFAKIESQ
ncbi:MAG: glutamate formimidoyltransferase [Candidatus Krumholzibacteria bacterium]|nr:glutamate formimidoyltransferase [Candidatus Krumholzibacteria bacterium]